MGTACSTEDQRREEDVKFTTIYSRPTEEGPNNLVEKRRTQINNVKIMDVNNSKLNWGKKSIILGQGSSESVECSARMTSKEALSCTGFKKMSSLLRLPTIFKVEPSHFRLEKKKEFLESRYEVKELIGRGAFGELRKIIDKKTGQKRALKEMTKNKCQMTDNFADEIEIIKKLDHPNVVRFFEFYQDEESYFLVTEFCEGGDLMGKIAKEKRFTEDKTAIIMMQLLSAIKFCHSNNIVHRDLKPENIMLDGTGTDCFIKVIDFGRSKILTPKEKIIETAGTLFYIAPEVLLNKEYNQSCDIWSAGVIMYFFLCGKPPFYSRDREEVKKLIVEGKIDWDLPESKDKSVDAISLIQKMLQRDPEKRLSANQALQHQWIQKYNAPFQVEEEKLVNTLGNLTAFKTQATFQKAVLAYIASQQLNKKDEQNLKEVFQLLDTNKDGLISKDELFQVLILMHGDEKKAKREASKIIRRVDLNQNGSIDYNEFLMANLDLQEVLSEESLKRAFDFFDANNDGGISLEELKQYFTSCCTDKIIDKLLKEVDTNSDGIISYEEFVEMMKNFQKFNKEGTRFDLEQIKEKAGPFIYEKIYKLIYMDNDKWGILSIF